MTRPPCTNCGTDTSLDLCPECGWLVPIRRRRLRALWWRIRGVRVSPYDWPDCGGPE